MKSEMKKLLAVLMTVALAFSFCLADDDDTTTTVDPNDIECEARVEFQQSLN